MEINTGYEELANAIIIKAAKDYRKAAKRLQELPYDKEARKEIRKCKKFFNSKCCNLLSDVDGKYILRKLREERR